LTIKSGRKINMIVTSTITHMSAEAYLGDYPIYVTYGELVGEHVEGTTERIGHFLLDGEPYPETEEQLRVMLERIVA